MITTPTPSSDRFGLRLISQARAILAVSALAALAVTTLGFAQAPTFNTLVTTFTGNPGYENPNMAGVGDFNGDGKLDAIVGTGSDNLRLMLGNGDGTFTQSYVSSPGAHNQGAIRVADLNGDGRLDAITVSNQGNLAASVLINTGNIAGVSQFTATNYVNPGFGTSGLRSLTVGDLNGDGKPDFVVGSANGGIRVWRNNGDGTFTGEQYYGMLPGAGGPSVGAGVIADLNGDGKADYLVTSNQNHAINIFWGNGDCTFQATPAIIPATDGMFPVVSDLNHDGKPDFLAVDIGTGMLQVYLNNGNGTFSGPTLISTGLPNPVTLAFTDMNGDGKPDVVTSDLNIASGNNNVAVLLGNGDGTFGAPNLYNGTRRALDLAVGDFNGDGKPDIGMVGLNDDTYGVLTNTTPIALPPTPTLTASAPALTVPGNITVNATSAAGATVNFTATATSTESMEILRRDAVTAEPWKSYTKTFTSGVTGPFKLNFNVVSASSGDNSIFIDDVNFKSGASTLLSDGFEPPALGNTTQNVSTPATLGSNWFFNNYGGILQPPTGSAPWGSIANGTPPQGSQFAVLRDVLGVQTKMTSVSTISLVAGQVYTVSFQQASREIFGGTLTYTVTLERQVSVPVTATPASGSTFPIGTTTVNLSATNSAGGTTTGSFTVTVKGTPPVITAASPFNVEATSSAGASPTIPATAVDFNGASLPVTVSPVGPYAIGLTQVNLSATDSNGLTTTKQIVVNVVDSTAPAITATMTAKGGGDDESSQFFTIAFSATDVVSGVRTLTAVLNGVTVTNGQIVQLQTIKSGAQSVKRDDGKLQIKAVLFKLTVTATDTRGNVSIPKDVVPVFVKNGKDSEEKKDDGKKDDDKKVAATKSK